MEVIELIVHLVDNSLTKITGPLQNYMRTSKLLAQLCHIVSSLPFDFIAVSCLFSHELDENFNATEYSE